MRGCPRRLLAGVLRAGGGTAPAAQSAGRAVPAGTSGQPTSGVLVEGGADRPSRRSLELVETRVGQPLSMAAVRESIAHLYSLGRFQDVQVEATEAPGGGVVLRFNLMPLHSVQRIEFQRHARPVEGDAAQRRSTIASARTPPLGRALPSRATLEQLYADTAISRRPFAPSRDRARPAPAHAS